MNNELFIVKPSLHQYYGRTVKKDTKFDEKTDNGKVHQILENLVLKTEINTETEYNGIKSKEHSELTQKLPENTVLIWNEEEGYIVPNREVYKIKDLVDDINQVKEIYKDNTDMNPKD